MYLSVCIFDGGDVGVSEGAMDEPEHEAGLSDSPGPEHDDSVVVALLRHPRISLQLPVPVQRGRWCRFPVKVESVELVPGRTSPY